MFTEQPKSKRRRNRPKKVVHTHELTLKGRIITIEITAQSVTQVLFALLLCAMAMTALVRGFDIAEKFADGYIEGQHSQNFFYEAHMRSQRELDVANARLEERERLLGAENAQRDHRIVEGQKQNEWYRWFIGDLHGRNNDTLRELMDQTPANPQ